MGSKRQMLANGLGTLLKEEATSSKTFWDLFCGSGAVSWFVAEQTRTRVHAGDLQGFAVLRTKAVVERTQIFPADSLLDWLRQAEKLRTEHRLWPTLAAFEHPRFGRATVERARSVCSAEPAETFCHAYGGHYFGPRQALTIDCLISTLPIQPAARVLCKAALVAAVSRCAASPGHTAQPFQPTPRALPYIKRIWTLDPLEETEREIMSLRNLKANRKGQAEVADANTLAKEVRTGDLVFIDPPYSGVQYSRFYHVLEAISEEVAPAVFGAGRYPPHGERPQSDYSKLSKSARALSQLLETLADREAKVVLTFPTGECSNGLSGAEIEKIARDRFSIRRREVVGTFSTLGGNNVLRTSRTPANELLLLLRPR